MLKKIGMVAAAFGLMLVLGLWPQTVKAANYDGLGQVIAAWLEAQSSRSNMQPPNSALRGKTIVIDPGHGGNDTGAIGPSNLKEKTVTLAIGKELQNLLTSNGARVIMTRTTDKSVAYIGASDKEELAARVAIANNANADLFVSIHADAYSGQAGGTTTYVYDTQNAGLAPLVQANLVSQLKLNDRGIQQSDYYVLKNTTMPAILTEAAFITNTREEKLLMNRSFDKKVAIGIYNGINQYFGS
jgi:N-acetylmuramoyl-L-alanine amidase